MANREDDLKRLRELERQVREFTDEDLLREAEELEREMLEQNIEYDIPPGFYEQIVAKGKLIEAERALHKNQKPDKYTEAPVLRPEPFQEDTTAKPSCNEELAKDNTSETPPKKRKFWTFRKK